MATESEEGEPLSPAARLFHSPRVNCCIIAIIGCKTSIDSTVVKDGLHHTLLNHPRFSSKLVKGRFGRKKWIRTAVNLEDHVIVPNLNSNVENPDQYVEDYISNITRTPLDLSKPLWELHLLNLKTVDAEAIAILRVHHSIGDGASLMSLLLACTRKTSDPESVPSISVKKRAGSGYPGGVWWFLFAVWSLLRLLWNTIVDVVMFLATLLFLKDTMTPIKGVEGVELSTKRFLHRTLSLEHIKQVKTAMNMTINDVLLGITQAGLSQYLNYIYGERETDEGTNKKGNNLPKSIRLRATILVNLRPTSGIQELADMMAKGTKTGWGNWIGYVILPFNIALQPDPLRHLHQAKSVIDRKKLSLEAICTFSCAKFILKTLGVKVTADITHRVFSNTTMSFSNMVGPSEEISFYGHPIAYIAPSVYGHPHALTIHYQSYADKMTVALAVDPNVIQDPHLLFDNIEKSLKLIRDAV